MTELSQSLDGMPFGQQLALVDGSVLAILSVKRYLPQRRVVCRGVWNNQLVFAKLFFGKEALRYAARDKAGVTALAKAQIKTPVLINEVAFAAPQGVALIFEAIEPAPNAEVLWQALTALSRQALMQQLVNTVAQHHQANLIQTDLYLKNFLVQRNTIYTLDGDGIRTLSGLFKKRQKLRNLATLFSKMDVLEDEWINDLYQRYCLAMQIPFLLQDATHVWQLTQKIRAKVSNGYADKKVFRSCTDVKVMRHSAYFMAVSRDCGLDENFGLDENTVQSLDGYLANPAQNIKNGHTCTIVQAQLAHQQVVIKRYNIKSWAHGISRALRKSRAALSWANAHRLMMANIATPKPLALVEERAHFFSNRTYFVSEWVDAPDVAQFFAQALDVQTKQVVAFEVAHFFYRLSLLKISHGDCKASNIKIKDGKPLLLDLDAMQANTWFFEQKHIKDLKRFMRNWVDDAETSALFKAALVRAYDEVDDPWEPSLLARAGID